MSSLSLTRFRFSLIARTNHLARASSLKSAVCRYSQLGYGNSSATAGSQKQHKQHKQHSDKARKDVPAEEKGAAPRQESVTSASGRDNQNPKTKLPDRPSRDTEESERESSVLPDDVAKKMDEQLSGNRK